MGKNCKQRKRTRVHSTSSQEGDVCVSCGESVDGEAVESQWCAKWEHMKCANETPCGFGNVNLLTKVNEQINKSTTSTSQNVSTYRWVHWNLGFPSYRWGESRKLNVILHNVPESISTDISERISHDTKPDLSTLTAYMFRIQKWKEIVDLFSSNFGSFLLTWYFNPKVDGNGTFSYIVTKMSNNDPHLDCFSLPLLDDTFVIKQSSKFGLF